MHTFVMTKDMFCHDKHVCCNKSMLIVTKLLFWQNYVWHQKHNFWGTKLLSREAYLCRNKRCVCRDETRVCHNKTLVATKMILVAAPANDKSTTPVVTPAQSAELKTVLAHSPTEQNWGWTGFTQVRRSAAWVLPTSSPQCLVDFAKGQLII